MNKKSEIAKEVQNLIEEAQLIIEHLQGKSKDEKYSFHLNYQSWYSKTLKVVEVLAPDRYSEFKSFYEIDPKRKSLGYGTFVIQDYIKGVAPSYRRLPDFDTQNETLTCMYNQYTILASLESRIDSILTDIETTLLSELQEDELSQLNR